jgi:hypothetical protein
MPQSYAKHPRTLIIGEDEWVAKGVASDPYDFNWLVLLRGSCIIM